MNYTPVIEKHRQSASPYAASPLRLVFVADSEGRKGHIPVRLEWYRQHPHSLVMVAEQNGNEIVWELSRDLFHLANVERGVLFGRGDYTVCASRCHFLVSLRNVKDKSWRTLTFDVATVAELLSHAELAEPIQVDELPNPKPYTIEPPARRR